MRVGFAGTPDFAARALAALHEGGYTIPLVLTRPDRPSGRGMSVTPSAVKRYAVANGLSLQQAANLRTAEIQAVVRAIDLDVLVVAAYGVILPQAVLAWPRHGCLNIHASLLPRWRGAAPIARTIEAGDTVTGVTIMQMDAGVDTGPIICREELAIGARETAGTLHDRLAGVGGRLIVETLHKLGEDGVLDRTPQPAHGATYAAKLERGERRIDWSLPAFAIDRKVRALSPAPGAIATWRGAAFKVGAARPLDIAADAAPGTVVAVDKVGIDVACADRTRLRVTEVQPAGGRPMPANAFAAGRAIAPGVRLGSAVA